MNAMEMHGRKRLLVEWMLEYTDREWGDLSPSTQTQEIARTLIAMEEKLRELGIELAVSPRR